MNVKSILQHVITATIPSSRRDRRSSDFQPLTPYDVDPEQNFDGANHANTFRRGGGPGGSQEEEEERFMEQPPIEMKSLKRGRQKNLHNLARPHANDYDETTDLVPPPIQVYNPTSEALPEEATDSGSQFTFPDVRLAIQEVFGGNDDNENPNRANLEGGEEVGNELDIRGGGRKFGCIDEFLGSCCASRSRWSEQHGVLMAVIIGGLGLFFMALLIVVLVAVRDMASGSRFHIHKNENHTIINNETEDLKVLSSQEWPLQDVESRKQNLSFDTMARAHQTWNFDKDDSEEDDEEREQENNLKPLKNSTRKSENATDHIPKVNGVILNTTIVTESLTVVRRILSKRLHENSSKLDVLSWKGLAGAVAIEELILKTTPLAAHYNTSIEGFLPDDLCVDQPVLKCNRSSHFRSINGECNNIGVNPYWGSQYLPLRRITDFDFVPSMLEANNEEEHDEATFPSPETISSKVHGRTVHLDVNTSALLPFWGMLILHDTVKVADSPVSCCNYQESILGHPVAYKGDDDKRICNLKSILPYTHGGLSQANGTENNTCSSLFPFPAMYPSCNMDGPRSSFNLATSYIDASNIYGSSTELSSQLRLKKDGKLKVQPGIHNHTTGFLLNAAEENETCFSPTPIKAKIPNCFLSGDPDVNQVAVLTSLNTILMRQHNYIASWLQRLNKHWDDDRTFEESRRLLIAQIQHITYHEFLPEILGKEMMEIGRLALEKADFYRLYDPVVNPTVSIAFAGAVGYFWLSMVSGQAKSIWGKAKLTQEKDYSIDRLFYMPWYLVVHRRNLEALLTGFMSINSNHPGVQVSSQLHSLHLNATNSTLDMVKMIIQRGRDLEIAPYVEWRRLCGFPEIKYLNMLRDIWEPEAFENITQVYKDVHQIDLFTGMLAEKPIRSGRVGPTLACLLTDQFLRFKKGDRFWYEGHVYSGHFTPEQLKEVRKTTLARIICDNTDDDFQELQRWPMLMSTPDSNINPILLCNNDSRIPRLNFRFWKEMVDKEKDGESKGSSIDEDGNWYVDSAESHEIGPKYSIEVSNDGGDDKVGGGSVNNTKNGTTASHTEPRNNPEKSAGNGTENYASVIDDDHHPHAFRRALEHTIRSRKRDGVRVQQNHIDMIVH